MVGRLNAMRRVEDRFDSEAQAVMRHWSQDDFTDSELEREGLEALESSDRGEWDYYEDAGTWLPVVAKNRVELQRRGTFERALLRAWYANLGTTAAWQPAWIEQLFPSSCGSGSSVGRG